MYIGTYGNNGRLPSLIQRAAHPKLSAGAVPGQSHLLLSEKKVTKNGKPSVLTVIYRFCARLTGTPKLAKPGKKLFCESIQVFRVNTFLF